VMTIVECLVCCICMYVYVCMHVYMYICTYLATAADAYVHVDKRHYMNIYV